MKTSRLLFWLLILALSAFAFGLDSCKATRPLTEERPNAGMARPAARLDPPPTVRLPDSSAQKWADQTALFTRLFSTPAGSARRQARKDAAATVPRSIRVKDGAFSWGGDAVAIGKKATAATAENATAAATGKKSGPAAVGSPAATVQATAGGAAAAGEGATAAGGATVQEAMGIGAALTHPIGQAIGAILIALVVGIGFWIWLHRPRTDDNRA